ncbi:YihY/virulence factor BrkB family protein, partial [Natronoarchaeum mannanilyticum]|uniref:YihY/virulence factor BrkB family protein n=1 Tax=Natronoarchaeum mannanilyticum TaxID=926360 RepID=UPI003606C7EF
MRQRLDAVPDDVRAVAVAAQSEQITFLAAAVAYYAFVSLIPLSLLGLVIASVMGGAVFEGQVVATAGEFLTPDAQNLLTEALTGEAGRGGATIVGTVVLLWSGLRLFRGLDKAFSQVYGTIGSKSIVNEFLNALAVSVAIVVGVASMTIIGAAIERLPAGGMSPQIGFALLVATLAVVFYPMYLLLPDADIEPREALPGTLFASLGWVVLGAGFQLYTANAGTFAAYGVLGGVLLLVTWLYFGALIVMLGAVINAVLADRLDADDAAAMDYEPGYDPSGLAEGAAAAGVGQGPNGAPGAREGGACTAGETNVHASNDRPTTDRQVQRDGARQSDTTEAMTGEDSSERPDDADADADLVEETPDSDSSATGAGDPKTDGGPGADADRES